MKIAWTLVLLSALSIYGSAQTKTQPHVMGKASTDDSPACKCDPEALDYAVIERLREADVDAWAIAHTKRAADGLQVRIDRVRALNAKVKDRCLKGKYEKWLDFEQSLLDSLQKQVKEDKQGNSDAAREEAKKQAAFKEAERCKRLGIVPALVRP